MIQVYFYPSLKEKEHIIKRKIKSSSDLTNSVIPIINDVKLHGDTAIKSYTKKYDHVYVDKIKVIDKDFYEANANISNCLKKSIEKASENIKLFHKKQIHKESKIKISKGIDCWVKNIPIEKIGFYIPSGSAPLLSTVLMLGIPGKLAGCKNIILCSPPNKEGKIHPSILYAAKYVGIDSVYKIGGAQAIAAMAYGTESIPSVYKIFGPGNSYVTKAKQIVLNRGIVSIDIPAGPSEVVIIADSKAYPEYVASDLLSQSEHDPESYIVLITNNKEPWINKVKNELKKQLSYLSKKEIIINNSLKNAKIVILSSLEEAIAFSNEIAPEHLIINCDNVHYWAEKVINAGSVFLGNYSPITAGDYASGTNHVLPTYGNAKFYSGVSIDSFVRKTTFQEISKEGLKDLYKSISILSSEEGLIAHKRSIDIRLKKNSF
ncbi:histidinol dehydrogenase [Blattabacterium cuenoti]|uniref:histidinol dehydrogenase n=1 Tax=Blattabacterium cuenoti TaxID=1653831 RepID=UPI00163CCB80|nr:histidinol dehydrogenase [Blattabacterium cuenoti]